MTPQEKAKQLVQRFYFSLPNNGSQTGINSVHDRWAEGKKCALIAVDEIINTLNYDIRDLDVRGSVLLDLIKYWEEAKQEIERL